MLERQAFEERFQADVLLGDLTWETSYALPGEGRRRGPGPTSRSTGRPGRRPSYRSWYIGEPLDEPPRIEIEIVLRIQRLAEPPDPSVVLDVLPRAEPAIGPSGCVRSGPTVETIYGDDLDEVECAIEVSYEGTYELDEDVLADGSKLDEHFSSMGGWIASTLVRSATSRSSSCPPEDSTAD